MIWHSRHCRRGVVSCDCKCVYQLLFCGPFFLNFPKSLGMAPYLRLVTGTAVVVFQSTLWRSRVVSMHWVLLAKAAIGCASWKQKACKVIPCSHKWPATCCYYFRAFYFWLGVVFFYSILCSVSLLSLARKIHALAAIVSPLARLPTDARCG